MKTKQAITAFKLAIKYKSNYAEAYFNLGSTFHHHGKLDDAIEAYEKAKEEKSGVTTVDGVLVEELHVKQSLSLINKMKMIQSMS